MKPISEVSRSCKYRLIAELGRGGMGEVCLAMAHGVAGFKKLVAVKRARADLSEMPEFFTMFLDEARLAARLNHPNVIQTYEADRDGDRYFIAMEYLDGQPLHRIRARVGAQWFPLPMQIRILIEALAGLHYAHELADFDGSPLGVVHRDATPQNVFVTYDGQIKVVDFGIAKAQNSMQKTRPGTLKGKVTYMAPEQARRQTLDRRADIFAVGIMLWEAITGERMWAGLFDSEILRRLEAGRIPALKARPPNDDPELARICRRALAPELDDRYATAAELQHALERWLSQRGEEITARVVGRFVSAHFDDERVSLKALLEHELRGSAASSLLLISGASAGPAEDIESTVIESKAPSTGKASEGAQISVSISISVSMGAPDALPKAPLSVESPEVPITTRSPSMDAILLEPPPSSRRRGGPISTRAQEPEGELEETMRRSSVTIDTPLLPALMSPSPRRIGKRWAIGSAIMISGFAAIMALRPFGLFPRALGAPAAAAEAREVNLSIHVLPATARIFLDGAPVSAGAYEGKLAKDNGAHRIHVEAPGFVPMEQSITASGELIVSLALQHEASSPR